MPKLALSILFAGLLVVLTSCSSVAIPYQDAKNDTQDPWSALRQSFETPEAPAETPAPKPAWSSRYKNLDRSMEIQAGTAIFASFNTVLRIDSPTFGIGTSISLEDDLGFTDTAEVFRLDLKYRLGLRHRFEFSNFSITRRANWKLDKEITIGGVTYPINIDISAALTTDIYKGAYRYLFAMGDSWDVSASIGLHTMGLGFGISEDATTGRQTSESFTLPLPVVGLGGSLALSEHLKIIAVADIFGIKIKNFSGYLVDVRLSLDWDIWDHVGAGIGWNAFMMDATMVDKITGDLMNGKFTYDYQGVLIYLRVFF